jgi:hypothetical protein
MNSPANVYPPKAVLPLPAEEARTTATTNLPSSAPTRAEQGEVKWSAQSETKEEKTSRLRREEAETESRLRREEAEAQHKLDEEKMEAKARRRNQLIGFVTGLSMILLIFVGCLWVIFSKQYPAETERWAIITLVSILTGSVTAIMAYAIGKTAGK